MAAAAILVVNAGSSSIKFSVFAPQTGKDPALLLRGQLESIGVHPRLSARDGDGRVAAEEALDPKQVRGHDEAFKVIAAWLRGRSDGGGLAAVGHRVVHGGPGFTGPVLADDAVLDRLEVLVPLAPLHQPANLAGIRAVRRAFPAVPQVACFDTSFHRGHPEVADRFALPDALYREGVRRYGFHGLSYEYIMRRVPVVAPDLARGRLIVAHLGSGASMCAIESGRSLDSTMGFTALDGLPMGTRCGTLDPGVVLYLMREKGRSVEEIERLLYSECGLRGLSGLSNDVRDLLASRSEAAALALDYFVYHVSRQLGALAAVLGGLDGIVFTAGIGERSAELRARICRRAGWLGLRLDEAANAAGGPRLTTPESAVSAWVIPTDEEMIIARHTLELAL
ncbi:MAG TPA: acetate/propionate family kinase [Stellaceae bacterium]|nr:acetate/propionate family kinase [Stellaceae bacterium]